MSLNEELSNLSKRIDNFKNKVKGEQATINAFVIPFIRLLGYDDTNPTEVVHQFTADIGTKKDEKVDHAILKDDKVIMLIECKDCRSDLSMENLSQLYRYFGAVTEARIGVLTNGILYRFYTDLKRPNVMDTDPFFEFNMSEINPSVVNVLNYFTKGKFDLENTQSAAIDLKYRGEIKDFLAKQLESPTDDFVGFLYSVIQSQVRKKDFTDIVKRAFNEFLDEQKNIQLDGSDREEQFNRVRDTRSNESDNGSDRKVTNESKNTNIKVTMPDGSIIHHAWGINTYFAVLEEFGLEEVMRVRRIIVSKTGFPGKIKGDKRGEFWVKGRKGYNNTTRIKELKKIAKLLKKSIDVEQIPI